MIGKNIALAHKGESRASIRVRLNKLLDYLDKADKEEHVSDVWYMNELSVETAEVVMLALSEVNARARLPYRHIVLSWPEGEGPEIDQMREAATILVNEIGCEDCLVKCAAHYDQDNRHIHVVVVTTDPETFKARKTEFIEEAIHRAVAKIEFKQGWKPEKNARYSINDAAECVRVDRDPNRNKAKPQKARSMELKTGRRSAVDILQAEVIGLLKIKAINSWEFFHRELAKLGIRYEAVGSGARFIVLEDGKETPVKASSVSSKLTLRALEKHFQSSFEATEPSHALRKRSIEPLQKLTPTENRYWQETRLAGQHASGMRHQALKQLKAEYESKKRALIQEQKLEWDQLSSIGWKGLGGMLNSERSSIAVKHAKQKAALKDWYDDLHITLVKKLRHSKSESKRKLASKFAQELQQGNFMTGPGGSLHPSYAIRGYKPVLTFARDDNPRISAVSYVNLKSNEIDFEDDGLRIHVVQSTDRMAVRAAVKLALEKWPNGFVINGSEAFVALVEEAKALEKQATVSLARPN